MHRFQPVILPLVLALSAALLVAPAFSRTPPVHLVTFQGPITPVAAEFLTRSLADAEDAGAQFLILRLDTPGGLDTSMRDIIKAQFGAQIPVVVYVAPSGSRAASAGAFITLAAHVAAMAPGTNIGSASPVQMGGAGLDSTLTRKVFNDARAYIASIAEDRGRNVEVASGFVSDALNLTAAEARAQGVIDLVAPDLPALLDSLQGRTVLVAGDEVILETADAEVVEIQMSARQKFLKVLANPNLAYILMMLGIYGLFFELSNPGSLVPGILGAICLLLALFAFQALPVDYTGIALIILGGVMLLLEIKVPSFGLLSIGGVAALIFGSLMIFDSPEAWARLSLSVLIPTVGVFAGFCLLCVWQVIKSQRRPVTTGLGALVGETGRLIQGIESADALGKGVFHGEIWGATAPVPLPSETQVRVVAVEGRIVRVVPVSPDDPSPEQQRR